MKSKWRKNQDESTGGPGPGDGGESSLETVSLSSVETPSASAPFERFLTEAGLMTPASFRQFLDPLYPARY